MIHLITSLSPAQIAAVAFLLVALCAAVTVWFCPRIFRYMPQDDE